MRARFLTRDEVAKRLGIGIRAVRRAAQTGDLPIYRLGTHIRVRPEDADRWLEGCRRPLDPPNRKR